MHRSCARWRGNGGQQHVVVGSDFSYGNEMVAGHVPFEAETPSEVIGLILNKEPPPLARYDREAPLELERIVSKALTKDLDERYQTAKDLLVDLKRLKRHLDLESEIERTIPPEFRASSSGAAHTGAHALASSQETAAGTTSSDAAHQLSSAESSLNS